MKIFQAGRKEPSEDLDVALVHLNNATKGLRRHLRRAVVDHVSDNFLDMQLPLLVLIDAARRGDKSGVEEYGRAFLEHAAKLVEVGNVFFRTFFLNAHAIFCLFFKGGRVSLLDVQQRRRCENGSLRCAASQQTCSASC